MASLAEIAMERFTSAIGARGAPGVWQDVDQDRINAFAEATLDRQFIHVDAVRAAAESPFGTTIAHGYLTLSLISYLAAILPHPDPDPYEGVKMTINVGLNRVRFISPVRSGSRVRLVRGIVAAAGKGADAVQVTYEDTIEIEGEVKPACVAETVTRFIY